MGRSLAVPMMTGLLGMYLPFCAAVKRKML